MRRGLVTALAIVLPFASADMARADARAWRAPLVLPGTEPSMAAITIGGDGLATVLHTDSAGSGAPELSASIGLAGGSSMTTKALHDDAYEVSIASDAAGNAIAAWNTQIGEIRVARKPAGATAFEPSAVVAGRTPLHESQPTYPKVAMNAAGHAVVHFVWQSIEREVGQPAAAFAAPGQPFGAPMAIGGEVPLQPFYDRRVSLAADGTAIVAWQQELLPFFGRIYMATGDAANGFSAVTAISESGRAADHVRTAAGESGQLAVSWVEHDPPTPSGPGTFMTDSHGTVAVARRGGDGTFVRQVVVGGEDDASSPDVGIGGGELVVAFVAATVARITAIPYAGAFGTPQEPLGQAYGVDLAVARDGRAAVLSDAARGEMTSARTPGGIFGPAQTLGPCLVRLARDFAVGPDGSAGAVYVQGSASGAAAEGSAPETGSVMAVSLDAPSAGLGPESCSAFTGDPSPRPGSTPLAPGTAEPPAVVAPSPLVPSLSLGRLRGRAIHLRASCAVDCRLRVRGTVRLGKGKRVRTAQTAADLDAGVTATVPLRLTRRGAAAARRALRRKRRLQVHLRGSSASALEGPAPVDRRLVLRAR